MKGKIIYNASLGRRNFLPLKNQTDTLVKCFLKSGVETQAISSDDYFVAVDRKGILSDIGEADFIIYLDKDVVRAKLLEKAGYKLFNSSKTIEICDDKAVTYEVLSGSVPLVPTLFPPLCFFDDESKRDYFSAAEKFGMPFVMKTRKGSLGEGVFKINGEDDYEKAKKKTVGSEVVFQKFYGKEGEDIRVIVVGGKAICAMRRINKFDFRANIERGGKGIKIDLTPEIKKLSEKVAKTVGADYCGVDILEGEEGFKVCEVNSNAFFGGISKATGVDVGEIFARYVFERIYCKN